MKPLFNRLRHDLLRIGGKFNLSPNTPAGKRRDISQDYLNLLNHSAHIMRLWMQREQLKR